MFDWKWVKRQIKIELDSKNSCIEAKIYSIRAILDMYQKFHSKIDKKK